MLVITSDRCSVLRSSQIPGWRRCKYAVCSVSVFSVLSIFADYPVCEFFVHDLKLQMTELGSNMFEHRVLGKNLQYKQKSWTLYVNSKHLLVSYVCIVHIMNKLVLFFGCSWTKCVCYYPRFTAARALPPHDHYFGKLKSTVVQVF
jgi:hypothetical protein